MGLESLVVRSSLKSARYANTAPDLNALAVDLAVDVVLTGSILRADDRVRVSAELVSVPAGDTWWSQTTHVPLDAVLDLHDELARRVVGVAAADGAGPGTRASPPSRQREGLRSLPSWHAASRRNCELARGTRVLRAGPELDPAFAPAWAERGRLDRVLGKYEDPAQLAHAESAFLRALELDPVNGAAQYYYAQLEIDLGRLDAALARLLERVRHRRAEPHVYAALVHACRYSGLLEESLAAHHQAQRLDPTVATTVHHTYYMQGDYARALREAHRSNDPFEARVLWAMGREAEALAAARKEESRFASIPLMRSFSSALRAALEGRRPEGLRGPAAVGRSSRFRDGEGLFYLGGLYAKLEEPQRAHAALTDAARGGLPLPAGFRTRRIPDPASTDGPWLAFTRSTEVETPARHHEFARAGGRGLLGLGSPETHANRRSDCSRRPGPLTDGLEPG